MQMNVLVSPRREGFTLMDSEEDQYALVVNKGKNIHSDIRNCFTNEVSHLMLLLLMSTYVSYLNLLLMSHRYIKP